MNASVVLRNVFCSVVRGLTLSLWPGAGGAEPHNTWNTWRLRIWGWCETLIKFGLHAAVLNRLMSKHCETSSSFRVFYLMKLKPQKESLILEYDFVTWKPKIVNGYHASRGHLVEDYHYCLWVLYVSREVTSWFSWVNLVFVGNKYTPWRYLVRSYSFSFLQFVINWQPLAHQI